MPLFVVGAAVELRVDGRVVPYPLLRAVYEMRDLVVLVPRVPLTADDVWDLLRSSSSCFLAKASFLCCSSKALLSASCCFNNASFSMSAASLLAPCQEGFKMSLWLCSVWESIRVHVSRRVADDATVLETV